MSMKKYLLIIVLAGILIVLVSNAGLNSGISKTPGYCPINKPWEHGGNSITVKEVVAVDCYTVPDGTEYAADTDGKILVVKCKVALASGWTIKNNISVSDAFGYVNLLCDPIQEMNDDSEMQILLFRLSKDFYSERMDYTMELYLESGEQNLEARFDLTPPAN